MCTGRRINPSLYSPINQQWTNALLVTCAETITLWKTRVQPSLWYSRDGSLNTKAGSERTIIWRSASLNHCNGFWWRTSIARGPEYHFCGLQDIDGPQDRFKMSAADTYLILYYNAGRLHSSTYYLDMKWLTSYIPAQRKRVTVLVTECNNKVYLCQR